MKFRTTRHLEQNLVRRAIPRELLEDTLANPQQVVPAHGGRKVFQSQFDLGEGKIYLLRAIVSEVGEQATVISVYRTSKVRKYWRT